jgi:hypothetical protein
MVKEAGDTVGGRSHPTAKGRHPRTGELRKTSLDRSKAAGPIRGGWGSARVENKTQGLGRVNNAEARNGGGEGRCKRQAKGEENGFGNVKALPGGVLENRHGIQKHRHLVRPLKKTLSVISIHGGGEGIRSEGETDAP